MILDLDIMFHFRTKLLAQLIIFLKFGDSFLVIVILLILFIYVVDCNTDDIDHIAEERRPTNLDHHHN